jgi:hypothetical protein
VDGPVKARTEREPGPLANQYRDDQYDEGDEPGARARLVEEHPGDQGRRPHADEQPQRQAA